MYEKSLTMFNTEFIVLQRSIHDDLFNIFLKQDMKSFAKSLSVLTNFLLPHYLSL